MNLATIVVPEDEARAKVAEYEKALRTERNVEDEAIAQAYRAAARGLAVISLSRAIGEGGYFDDGSPRIAVGRATWPNVLCRWSSSEGDRLTFWDDRFTRWPTDAMVGRDTINVTPTAQPSARTNSYRWRQAPVPLVPPRCRPKRPRLANLHILWEVEKWAPVPSADPALIKHIRGDLWAVLATWDLTDLELAVLAQRSA